MTIERVVAGGDGLGRLMDGRVVFVPGGLAGETVRIALEQQRRDFARGRLLSVEVAAPQRVAPPCPALAAGCGGCDWQHLAPAAQLDVKVGIVREAVRRTARVDVVPVDAGGSVPAWGYRTSMRMAVGPDGRLGLRRARSSSVVPLTACPVAHPLLESLLTGTTADGGEEVSLRVSAATGEATAWVAPVGSTRRAPRLSVPSGVAIGADAVVHEVVAGVRLVVSAGAFFQSGPAAGDLLVDAVRRAGGDELASASHVVDAYGGGGLFSATAVPPSARITLVEGSRHACADARRNLDEERAEVVCSPIEQWAPRPADVVVADPARTGLGAAGAQAVAACRAPVVVLVSCDPAAGARDLRLLADEGYELERCEVLDLFPQTHHVEMVSRLVRREKMFG